jgi:hypothetical protein
VAPARTPGAIAAHGSFRRDRDGDIITCSGDVAQLGERRVRNAKVEGSIPFVSTTHSKPADSGGLLFDAGTRRHLQHVASEIDAALLVAGEGS